MEENNYSKKVLMKLFILYRKCVQIIRTWTTFNKIFSNLEPMNEKKIVKLEKSFFNSLRNQIK